MSLINEALRKARKEAAERDAEERGVSYRPPRAHLPTERSWLPALAGVALGAVLAAAAFVFWMPSAPEPEPTPAEPAAAVPNESPAPVAAEPVAQSVPGSVPESMPESMPEPDEASPAPPPEPEDRAALPATEAPPPDASISQSEPESPPSRPAEPEGTQSSRPPETPETPEPVVTQRIEPPAQVGQVEEAVYVLEAQVDGVALRLDFIVWAPASPFAQINGRQVSVGQQVDGFVVRAIAREEVTLEGESGRFRLRVR